MSKPDASPARPMVTLKIATSLDGRIATRTGRSQWITSPEARRQTHLLRARHDAIIVGSGTVLADDPMLTARCEPPATRQPFRIVADGRLRTPLTARLVKTATEFQTALCVGMDVEDARHDDYLRAGVEIWEIPIAPFGGVSVTGVLSRCAEEGLESLFLEGGGRLAASFLRAGVVDRIEWFRAPIILGGDAVACVGDIGVDHLNEAPRFSRTDLRACGPDIWESYELKSQDTTGE